MTQRAITSIIALVCGTLVAASGASASPVDLTAVSGSSNFPGNAGSAVLQESFTATSNDTKADAITVVVTEANFTAPTAPPGKLLLDTTISGSVGTSGTNSANVLSFTGSVDTGSLTVSPLITSSGSFSDTAKILISSLSSPFTMTDSVTLTLGAGATVSVTAIMELTPAPAPLPATLPLFATGLGAMGLLGWRRKRKQAVA